MVARPGQHLDRMLRRQEALQPALLQRVEHHDGAAALRHIAQRRQHARMVGAGIVAHAENEVGVVEVFERHRAFADADGIRQADARRLVAHVGAVGEIVGAELAHEHLIHERRFVRCAARGVELRHVRIGQLAQLARRCARTRRPRRWARSDRSPRRRSSDASDGRRPPSAKSVQFHSSRRGMRGEELEVGALARRFPRHRLGAVLAELER